jgi:mannose/fructose/sorbose-specific phosphotransferase system IIA component
MVGVIIVSHGSLARYLIEAAEMIVGSQDDLEAIGLQAHQGLDEIKVAIDKAYLNLNKTSDGVLALVDLQGGTPGNAACMLVQSHNISIVSGVNLPMLLEVLLCRQDKSLEELTEIALRVGKEGIRDLSALIREKLEPNQDG